ncbi:MAG: glycosyltransferase family 2 protein, partial [Candidatus Bathyarchaeota archaeon]
DGSVDRTVGICERYSGKFSNQLKLVRKPDSNGKPSALNYALKHATGEMIAVLDADSVLEPDALSRLTKHFEDQSIAAVQGRACSINANENMLAKFISYEETVRYETYIRGKAILKLFVPLTGSCYCVRRTILDEVGGWEDQALSEDMEMAAKLTERGHRIKYAPDVRSWQENPTSLTQLFSQRIRWFRGSMEVSLKYGRLLRNPSRTSFDAEMTLTGPFMFLPSILGYILGLLSLVFPLSQSSLLAIMSQGLMFVNTMTLFLIGLALIHLTKPKKVTSLLWLPFVYGYWMVQNLVALCAFAQIVLKRPRKWMKTARSGVATETNYVP